MFRIKSVLIVSIMSCNAAFADDSFIKDWAYFDGYNTYHLTIKPQTDFAQDYSINYTFSGGHSGTDFCVKSGNNTITCITGETLNLSEDKHKISIESKHGNYTFYDPDFMPAPDDILGKWSYKQFDTTYVIIIMRGGSAHDYLVLTRHSGPDSHCDTDMSKSFDVTYNSDGTQTLTHPLPRGSHVDAFKYDPLKKEITNPVPGNKFSAGFCAGINDIKQDIVFKKN